MRVSIQSDKTAVINLPATLTNLYAISDMSIRQINGSYFGSSCGVYPNSFKGSQLTFSQDTITDQGGYVLIIGS